MNTLVGKLVAKEPITENDLEDALYEICNREHAGCNNACPVFEKLQDYRLCNCFKDGKAMLSFLRKANP